uniref:LNR domain-containing protein n=1 Tax=Steinernema glaseri TaxID=37863 RepID=A0A1I7ZWA3_9BILA
MPTHSQSALPGFTCGHSVIVRSPHHELRKQDHASARDISRWPPLATSLVPILAFNLDMNAVFSLLFALTLSVHAQLPELVAYGPCLDDGSCPMPLGVCKTDTFECVGINDPSLFELEDEEPSFDLESYPDLIRYGPCLQDGTCPMENGICFTETFECVGFEEAEGYESDKFAAFTNATGVPDFDELALDIADKVGQMESRGVFSLKTEL